MTEQAPAGDLGGNLVPETWQRLTKPEIDALAEGNEYSAGVYITQIDSDSSNCEASQQELNAKIDGLLTMFGIDPDLWRQQALKLTFSNRLPRERSGEYIQKHYSGRPAGEKLFDWASHNLRIEDEEDGYGEVKLVIKLADGLLVTLSGEGDHWSGSSYQHPETGEILTEHWDDAKITELMSKYDDVESIDYEVAFSLKFNALFSRPDAEESS